MWILGLIYALHFLLVEQLHNLHHFIFIIGSWERFIKYENESVPLNQSPCSPDHLLDQYQGFSLERYWWVQVRGNLEMPAQLDQIVISYYFKCLKTNCLLQTFGFSLNYYPGSKFRQCTVKSEISKFSSCFRWLDYQLITQTFKARI